MSESKEKKEQYCKYINDQLTDMGLFLEDKRILEVSLQYQELGNKIHDLVMKEVNRFNEPNLLSELAKKEVSIMEITPIIQNAVMFAGQSIQIFQTLAGLMYIVEASPKLITMDKTIVS